MHDHSNLNRNLLPSEDVIIDMSTLLKVTADATRLKILLCLQDGEKNVCCLQEFLDKSQSLISHQLAVLKQHNLVKSRCEQNRVYYSLLDNHVLELLKVVYDHVNEE